MQDSLTSKIPFKNSEIMQFFKSYTSVNILFFLEMLLTISNVHFIDYVLADLFFAYPFIAALLWYTCQQMLLKRSPIKTELEKKSWW